MLPVKLTMSAFGAFRDETTIDFSVFGKSGIYLVAGDTGSGKSTIFEAIVFALYGKPSNEEKKPSMLRSVYCEDDARTFVRLEFEQNGELYAVERSPSYVNSKGKNVQRKDEMAMPDGRIVAKSYDVDYEIEKLIGLDKDQFCRVAMLSQGQFRQILIADTKEREELYRTLFNTGRYDYFTDRIKELRNEQSRLYEEIDGFIDETVNDVRAYLSMAERSPSAQVVIAYIKEKQSEAEQLLTERSKERGDREAEIEKLGKLNEQAKLREQLTKQLAQLSDRIRDLTKDLETAAAEEKTQAEGEDRRAELRRLIADIDKSREVYESLASVQKEAAGNSAEAEKGDEEIRRLETLIKELAGELDAAREKCGRITPAEREKIEKKTLLEKYDRLGDLITDALKKKALLDEAQKALEILRADYALVAAQHEAAAAAYTKADAQLKDNMAGIMAAGLKEGLPCPVCGSTNHPAPAALASGSVTREDVDKAKAAAEKAEKLRNKKRDELSSAQAKVDADKDVLAESVEAAFADAPDTAPDDIDAAVGKLKELSEIYKKQRETLRREIADLDAEIAGLKRTEELLPEKTKELDELKDAAAKKREAVSAARARAEELKKQADKIAAGLDYPSYEAALKARETFAEELEASEKKLAEAKEKVKKLGSELDTAKGGQGPIREQLDALPELDPAETDAKLTEAKELKKTLDGEIDSLKDEINKLSDACKKMSRYANRQAEAQKKLDLYEPLYKVFTGSVTGKEKIKLETYVQTKYFEALIARANVRFLQMSRGQFELRRSGASGGSKKIGLDLVITDHHNNTTRDVRTLSGGESFLASLSMALGLSDEIRDNAGGIDIDALFIDEGFGSLDRESLSLAVKTLAELGANGKIIGVISHVAQLRDSIERGILVDKKADGAAEAITVE